MANQILLKSGSVLNGNPITFEITPSSVTGTPSFHRVLIDVVCGMSGGNYETLRMFEPVISEGRVIETNISSALQTFRDSWQYEAQTLEFPLVKFRLEVYDEYMVDGEVKKTEPIYYPSADTYISTIFGNFNDIERLTSNVSKPVMNLTRKPTSTPQLASVGEILVYAQPYDKAYDLMTSSDMPQPTSATVNLTKKGQQTVGGISLYVIPQSEAKHRMEFRFINSFGVMESVSIPRSFSQSANIKSNSYILSRRESFGKFSRSVVRKESGPEKWQFATDPLDEEWLRWYLYEFLMAKHVWIKIGDVWIPCNVNTDDEDIVLIDKTKEDMLTVTFKVELGVNGNPYL